MQVPPRPAREVVVASRLPPALGTSETLPRSVTNVDVDVQARHVQFDSRYRPGRRQPKHRSARLYVVHRTSSDFELRESVVPTHTDV